MYLNSLRTQCLSQFRKSVGPCSSKCFKPTARPISQNKRAGFHCRFHDLRHTAITKLAETQASDMTIMAIAGHVSKKMLERYSHVRMTAKRKALDAIVQDSELPDFVEVVHQNVHQLRESASNASSKPLN